MTHSAGETTITSASLYALDYRVQARELARDLRPSGGIPWPLQDPVRTRLWCHGDQLWITERSSGVTGIGASGDTLEWTRWPLDLSSIGPGWQSDPVAITHDGTILRIAPEGDYRTLFDAGLPGDKLSAIGLPEERLILKRYEASGNGFELWSERRIWRREGAAHEMIPHGGSLYRLASSTLERIDIETGQIVWSSRVPGRSLVGAISNVIWLSGDALLLGLDAQSGAVVHTVKTLNNRAVEGVLDDAGHFHSVTGLRNQIYDLENGGELVADYVLKDASTAPGNFTRLATAGRIVFPNDRGHLFRFDPHEPEPLTRIAAFPPPAPEFGIAHGKLWVLALGELRCFGR